MAATGTPAPTYQCQISTSGGSNWSSLTNSSPYSGVTTDASAITGANVAMNGYQYGCLATNLAGSANSHAAILTVTLPKGDFSGDGQTDLLWRNSVNGYCGVMLMDGTAPGGWVSLGYEGTDWTIVN